MTCFEALMRDNPVDYDDKGRVCVCVGCPQSFGYADEPEWCEPKREVCEKCWNRPVKEGLDKGHVMTCRERKMLDVMAHYKKGNVGLLHECPHTYGYADKPEWCEPSKERCAMCWNRPATGKTRKGSEKTEKENKASEEKEKNFKELMQTAKLFSDDILCAVGTDFLLNIAEAECQFIFELLGKMKTERKHGHWKSLTDCANAGVYCSVCNKKVWKEDYAECNRKNKIRSNYCPNCGARMSDDE